jgi:hypothetical protein
LENRASLSLKQSPNLISPNKKTAQEEHPSCCPPSVVLFLIKNCLPHRKPKPKPLVKCLTQNRQHSSLKVEEEELNFRSSSSSKFKLPTPKQANRRHQKEQPATHHGYSSNLKLPTFMAKRR